MNKSAAELFGQTAISTDDKIYTMVKLPPDAIETAAREVAISQAFD